MDRDIDLYGEGNWWRCMHGWAGTWIDVSSGVRQGVGTMLSE